MSALTNYMERMILNTLRGTTAVAPATVYMALFLTDPTETGAAGTEISYTGYARQAVTFAAPTTSGQTISTSNSAQISFPAPQSAAGSVNYVALMDASTGGNMLVYVRLASPVVMAEEVVLAFDAGGFVLALSSGNIAASFKSKIFGLFRATNIAGFTPYLALYGGDPENGGAELSGVNYARLGVTFSEPEEQVSGQAQISNTNSATSSAASEWGSWAYSVIMDASTGGNRVLFKQNTTAYQMTGGAYAFFEAGDITAAIN